MATLRLLLAAALLALPLWVASTAPAHACSCASQSAGEDVSRAEVIILGTVHDVHLISVTPGPGPETPINPANSPHGDVEWTVDVEEYLKGSGPNQLSLSSSAAIFLDDSGEYTFRSGLDATCRWAPSEGMYILFMGRRDDGGYGTGGCAPNFLRTQENEAQFTQFLTDIRAAVVAEQVGLPPTGSGSPHHGAPIIPLVVASALAGLGLAANAAFALRRRS